jgi:RNA polymerase sigma factor (sigma-70 family)
MAARTPLTDEQKERLGALLRQWEHWIVRLAVRRCARQGMVARPDLVEEYRSAILGHIVDQFHTFDPARSNFATWTVLVARHAAGHANIQAQRRIKTVNLLDRDHDDDNALSLARDPRAADPTEEAERREQDALVAAAVEGLPDHQRAAIHRRYYDPDDTIAERGELDCVLTAFAGLRSELARI